MPPKYEFVVHVSKAQIKYISQNVKTLIYLDEEARIDTPATSHPFAIYRKRSSNGSAAVSSFANFQR